MKKTITILLIMVVFGTLLVNCENQEDITFNYVNETNIETVSFEEAKNYFNEKQLEKELLKKRTVLLR